MGKFKIGDTVKVRDGVLVGVKYYNEDLTAGDKFTNAMKKVSFGKDAMITAIVDGGYKLDIDKIHTYYDGMLEYTYDELATKDYMFNYEVECLIDNVMEKHYKKALDTALDERMFETNPDEFKKIFDTYNSYIK